MDGDYLFYFTSDKDADKNNEGNSLAKEWTERYSLSNYRLLKITKFQVDEVIWNTAGGIKSHANLMLDDIEKYFLK